MDINNKKILDNIRERLDSPEKELIGSRISDDELLKKRAFDLARTQNTSEEETSNLEILGFLLGSEHYAFISNYVKGVVFLDRVCEIPYTPSFIIGVISHYGAIISIVDLRLFFGMQRHGISDYNKVIILKNDFMEFGILADQVTGIQLLERKNMQLPPAHISGIGLEYLSGVFPGPMMLLNADRILDDKRMIVQ